MNKIVAQAETLIERLFDVTDPRFAPITNDGLEGLLAMLDRLAAAGAVDNREEAAA